MRRPAHARPGNFWLPWASPKAGLAFDQIAAGSAAMMSLYSAAYSASVLGEVGVERRELYPEAVMWRHLERHGGAAAARVAPLERFRASLARHRADGTPKYDDPFGKLREDLHGPLADAQLAASLPTHYCRAHHGGAGGRARYALPGPLGRAAAAAAAEGGDEAACAVPACRRAARKAARKARRQGTPAA